MGASELPAVLCPSCLHWAAFVIAACLVQLEHDIRKDPMGVSAVCTPIADMNATCSLPAD